MSPVYGSLYWLLLFAAVVGGLAGIIYGFENIPTRWYEEIRGKEKILELIDKIHFEDI